jgi:hypothetical protein
VQQFLGLILDPGPEGCLLALFPAITFQDPPVGQPRHMLLAIAGCLAICIEALVITFKEFFVRLVLRPG